MLTLYYHPVTSCQPGNEDYGQDYDYDDYDNTAECKRERKKIKKTCIKFIFNGYLYEVLHSKKGMVHNEAQGICAQMQGQFNIFFILR